MQDKFCIGEQPRTSTGLVPTTFKKKREELIRTNRWSCLPPQPKKEMFKFRGDYINAKLRKEKEKKEKGKAKAFHLDGIIEQSSTAVIAPSSPRDSPTKGNTPWNDRYLPDAYKLAPNEQQKRADNDSRYTEFLRIQACKRRAQLSAKKQPETKLPQEDQGVHPKPKKPPVPRLSALARARAQGKQYKPKKTSTDPQKDSTCSEKSNISKNSSRKDKEVGTIDKQSRKYLSFISKQPDHKSSTDSPAEKTNENVNPSKEAASSHTSTMHSALEEDDSIFRLQLERIVRRASTLVTERQTSMTSDYNSFPSSSREEEVDIPTISKETVMMSNMRSRHSRLDELEDRLARISKSTVIEDISTTTDQESEDASFSVDLSNSVGTEVIPRVPVSMHPIHSNANLSMLRRGEWTSLYDHMHNDISDSSSDTTSTSSTEGSLYERNESFEETPSLQPSNIEPSIMPTRQLHDEHQPRPRGKNYDDGTVEESQSLKEEDFFSLFG